MREERLLAAVRDGDAEAVRALLDEGADADAVDEHGTPALCLAVDAFDRAVVEELLNPVHQARVDRPAADGRTPLLRAVGNGDHDIAELLIGRGARLWAEDAEGRDALALARHRHTTGVEAELRRRSGASGRIVSRKVTDEAGSVCRELSLGGLRMRDGHAAILTGLEPRYGITLPFAELLGRALAEPDPNHQVWLTAICVLQRRNDPADWAEAAALQDHPDPRARLFGAEVLHLVIACDDCEDESLDGVLTGLLLPWAAKEKDLPVLRLLAAGLSSAADARAERPLLDLTRHDDSVVRSQALSGLHWQVSQGHPEALAAALACARDASAGARETACYALERAPGDSSASDVLAACLDDENEAVRVRAAVRLALRDDARGDEVLRAVESADENSPYYWDLHQVWRHRRMP
ncbi:ankyrin repeat domain-containing protein [Streptomyces sp. UNOC14_S4]|uniref:ankyrin repeat domain-containing protein n=1 Tax=Streptomyces sp. UNOC14_S4 TaxID=2872340 RepID=UPI001E45226A|nr:ankyrin repeat domain-containing protein [Streptomyces sp. UNOC14_S4]MCC3769821.1 ankyrin repeat domain-containing protein [Streptomyces sp. UNOC14_S4]